MKIIYKVVRQYDGHWCSVVAKQTGLQLLYKVGHVTRPCIGKLFAFENLIHAQAFCRQRNVMGDAVFEVETSNIVCGGGLVTLIAAPIHIIIDFWKGKRVGDLETPIGTVLCDDIKLIRRV